MKQPMITVAEYNHVEQLKPLGDLWDRFLERTPDSCFSQSWDWVAGNCSPSKLRVLLALVSGRPFGLLPLQVETRKTEVGELRVLTNVGGRYCPFAGPIGPNITAMLTAAMRHLRQSPRDWDLIEWDLLDPTEKQKQRFSNCFRLMKWRCDAETTTDWAEVSPTKECLSESRIPSARFTLERVRAQDRATAPWPMLARCLSLVEELKSADEARQLRVWHQAGFRAGLTDWSLLRENGIPQAAALQLLTRGRWLCTALVGRSESARFELLKRLLETVHWEDDLSILLRSNEVPIAERWLNATPVGFRYTHVNPWALRTRWLRFRHRIQSRWSRPPIKEAPTQPVEVLPTPPKPKLAIYHPSPVETLNV
ncbi:MAG: hypothetical protein KDA84_28395 [Planctomycetaceae bacterium]|nr:hypothetical protein [Planctomycetaceae bacterium]